MSIWLNIYPETSSEWEVQQERIGQIVRLADFEDIVRPCSH